eukprot:TRINITY_DN3087_c0_g1_i1.p1 TRINITY_DN3087_c0_g1~~TRINITY_DN3087_c0_g1_i1.p1  ORF type:complete len:1404 (+),score=336.59 TRINITY_DN3087_c0_g1_i1:412-4212(+)
MDYFGVLIGKVLSFTFNSSIKFSIKCCFEEFFRLIKYGSVGMTMFGQEFLTKIVSMYFLKNSASVLFLLNYVSKLLFVIVEKYETLCETIVHTFLNGLSAVKQKNRTNDYMTIFTKAFSRYVSQDSYKKYEVKGLDLGLNVIEKFESVFQLFLHLFKLNGENEANLKVEEGKQGEIDEIDDETFDNLDDVKNLQLTFKLFLEQLSINKSDSVCFVLAKYFIEKIVSHLIEIDGINKSKEFNNRVNFCVDCLLLLIDVVYDQNMNDKLINDAAAIVSQKFPLYLNKFVIPPSLVTDLKEDIDESELKIKSDIHKVLLFINQSKDFCNYIPFIFQLYLSNKEDVCSAVDMLNVFIEPYTYEMQPNILVQRDYEIFQNLVGIISNISCISTLPTKLAVSTLKLLNKCYTFSENQTNNFEKVILFHLKSTSTSIQEAFSKFMKTIFDNSKDQDESINFKKGILRHMLIQIICNDNIGIMAKKSTIDFYFHIVKEEFFKLWRRCNDMVSSFESIEKDENIILKNCFSCLLKSFDYSLQEEEEDLLLFITNKLLEIGDLKFSLNDEFNDDVYPGTIALMVMLLNCDIQDLAIFEKLPKTSQFDDKKIIKRIEALYSLFDSIYGFLLSFLITPSFFKYQNLILNVALKIFRNPFNIPMDLLVNTFSATSIVEYNSKLVVNWIDLFLNQLSIEPENIELSSDNENILFNLISQCIQKSTNVILLHQVVQLLVKLVELIQNGKSQIRSKFAIEKRVQTIQKYVSFLFENCSQNLRRIVISTGEEHSENDLFSFSEKTVTFIQPGDNVIRFAKQFHLLGALLTYGNNFSTCMDIREAKYRENDLYVTYEPVRATFVLLLQIALKYPSLALRCHSFNVLCMMSIKHSAILVNSDFILILEELLKNKQTNSFVKKGLLTLTNLFMKIHLNGINSAYTINQDSSIDSASQIAQLTIPYLVSKDSTTEVDNATIKILYDYSLLGLTHPSNILCVLFNSMFDDRIENELVNNCLNLLIRKKIEHILPCWASASWNLTKLSTNQVLSSKLTYYYKIHGKVSSSKNIEKTMQYFFNQIFNLSEDSFIYNKITVILNAFALIGSLNHNSSNSLQNFLLTLHRNIQLCIATTILQLEDILGLGNILNDAEEVHIQSQQDNQELTNKLALLYFGYLCSVISRLFIKEYGINKSQYHQIISNGSKVKISLIDSHLFVKRLIQFLIQGTTLFLHSLSLNSDNFDHLLELLFNVVHFDPDEIDNCLKFVKNEVFTDQSVLHSFKTLYKR